jgi:hypothetical protein
MLRNSADFKIDIQDHQSMLETSQGQIERDDPFFTKNPAKKDKDKKDDSGSDI